MRESKTPHAGLLSVVVGSATRAIGVALAGISLVLGFAFLLWAITPSGAEGPGPMLRGGVTAFAAAHLVTVEIGNGSLSVTPLLITGLIAVLLASTTGRVSEIKSRTAEIVSILVAAVVYGVAVAVICAIGGAPGSIPSDVGLWAAGLAVLSCLAGSLIGGGGLKSLIGERVPGWIWHGLRAGLAVVGVVFAGGMIAFLVSLSLNLPAAATLSDSLAPSAGGAVGLTLMGIVFLPNAAVAATGWVTGVGFEIGPGRYSPFGSIPADLPPVPMLVGAPTNDDISYAGLAGLVVPLIAAVLAGIYLVRRLPTRTGRLAGVAVAGLVGAAGTAGLAVVAAGGISPGPWETMGAPALRVGAVILVAIWVLGGPWVALARDLTTVEPSPEDVLEDALSDEDELPEDDLPEDEVEPEDGVEPDKLVPDELVAGELVPDEVVPDEVVPDRASTGAEASKAQKIAVAKTVQDEVPTDPTGNAINDTDASKSTSTVVPAVEPKEPAEIVNPVITDVETAPSPAPAGPVQTASDSSDDEQERSAADPSPADDDQPAVTSESGRAQDEHPAPTLADPTGSIRAMIDGGAPEQDSDSVHRQHGPTPVVR